MMLKSILSLNDPKLILKYNTIAQWMLFPSNSSKNALVHTMLHFDLRTFQIQILKFKVDMKNIFLFSGFIDLSLPRNRSRVRRFQSESSKNAVVHTMLHFDLRTTKKINLKFKVGMKNNFYFLGL